ncbi:hypothetical protein BBAD15_g7882 [Beauveria bassiana D1-5]|uniref:Apple domain-containing protein n=1 Tax=Beauveria bassiana D1-5 TaxID=1245745 RepID=A0A0A2VKY7_BEABA|nr:hypothetical protein BBAD15_g7882 [Beauveria bassiana D1-5]
MSRPYSSSTTASRVAVGMPSRTHRAPKTLIPEGADHNNGPSQRTFFSTLSIRSGGGMAKRLSGRPSQPSTFYSEATPPGSSQGEPEPQDAYDGRYDHVAPPAPLPVATICGIRRRRFLIVLWVVVIAVIIAVAVPVGVVFGLRRSRHKNKSTNATRYEFAREGKKKKKKIIHIVAMSDVNCSTTSLASFASSTAPAATASTASPSAASTTTSTTTTTTSVVACPDANNTLYLVPNSQKTFRRFCGIDYSGVNQARDLGSVWTTTVQECILRCADFSGCTACGWGVIADDPGSEHRCWLKADLKALHGARPGWDFAILEQ